MGKLWTYHQMVNVENCDKLSTLLGMSVGMVNLMAESRAAGNSGNEDNFLTPTSLLGCRLIPHASYGPHGLCELGEIKKQLLVFFFLGEINFIGRVLRLDNPATAHSLVSFHQLFIHIALYTDILDLLVE